MSVKTKYGKYVGEEKEGVECYLGIPYAKPPMGKLRWQLPRFPDKSDREFKADSFGYAAMQPFYYEGDYVSTQPQNEDCLTLNIWKPKKDTLMPVMIFIHGGAGIWGSGIDPLYSGERMANNCGIVTVNINYRLNAFGYLDLSDLGGKDYQYSKNLGVYDQVQAIRWVKENIESFGGDPDNITVCGESAGGASLSMMLLMDEAKGLFGKAIIQSGSFSMCKRGMTDRYTKEVAVKLLYHTGAASFDEFKVLPADVITKAVDEMLYANLEVADGLFMPVIDGISVSNDPFESISSGAAKDIKFLIGSNKDEFNLWNIVSEDFSQAVENYRYPLLVTSNEKFIDDLEIYKEYVEKGVSEAIGELERKYMLGNDLVFRQGAIGMAERQCEHNDVFMYEFNYPSPSGLGACHGIEMSFIFDTPESAEALTMGKQPQTLTRQVQNTWAAFVKNGDPNNEYIPTWEKYYKNDRYTMLIDEEWEQVKDPRRDDRLILEKLYG